MNNMATPTSSAVAISSTQFVLLLLDINRYHSNPELG